MAATRKHLISFVWHWMVLDAVWDWLGFALDYFHFRVMVINKTIRCFLNTAFIKKDKMSQKSFLENFPLWNKNGDCVSVAFHILYLLLHSKSYLCLSRLPASSLLGLDSHFEGNIMISMLCCKIWLKSFSLSLDLSLFSHDSELVIYSVFWQTCFGLLFDFTGQNTGCNFHFCVHSLVWRWLRG